MPTPVLWAYYTHMVLRQTYMLTRHEIKSTFKNYYQWKGGNLQRKAERWRGEEGWTSLKDLWFLRCSWEHFHGLWKGTALLHKNLPLAGEMARRLSTLGCSSRGQGFKSQHPHAPNNLHYLQFQGIWWPLLASAVTACIWYTELQAGKTLIHIKNKTINFN